MKLFSIKIDLTPFSVAISEPSTMLDGNVLIFAYSFSAFHFLVVMCYIHHETELLHHLLVIL